MRTSTIISFGTDALLHKEEAITAFSESLQTFSKLSDLMYGTGSTRPYATLEPDFWVLDGGYKLLPDDVSSVHVGMFSFNCSNSSGDLSPQPALTISFSQVHSSDDLWLYFSDYTGDYADTFRVTYYDASNAVISAVDYLNTSVSFHTGLAVSNYKKIVINFYSTNKPSRYLRLENIDFGNVTRFDGTSVKKCIVTEQINPISTDLPASIAEFTVVSQDADLNIIEPAGIYATLVKGAPVDIHAVIGNGVSYMGRYYLDTWKTISLSEISFSCTDFIGLIESNPFIDGGFPYITGFTEEEDYDAVRIALDYAASGAGVDLLYTIDSSLVGVESGYSNNNPNDRDYIRDLLFAYRCYASSARDYILRVVKSPLASDATSYDAILTKTEMKIVSVELKPIVTGVNVYGFAYSLYSTASTILYLDNQPIGIQDVYVENAYDPGASFSSSTIGCSGVTPLKSHIVRINFTSTPNRAIVFARSTIESTQIFEVLASPAPSTSPNVVKFEKIKELSTWNAPVTAQFLVDYLQQRYVQVIKTYAPVDLQVGQIIKCETYGGRWIVGMVEKLEIDMTGGYRQRAEIVGVILPL